MEDFGAAVGHVGASRANRVAAALHVGLGLAFGLGSPPVLLYLARRGELPMSPFGWRYMAGPAEQFGVGPFIALGWALVAVCVLDVVAGVWLWQGRRRGLRLGMATDAAAFALAAGFALPAAPAGRAGEGGAGLGGAQEPWRHPGAEVEHEERCGSWEAVMACQPGSETGSTDAND